MGNILDICRDNNDAFLPESRIQILIRSGHGLNKSDIIGTSDPLSQSV